MHEDHFKDKSETGSEWCRFALWGFFLANAMERGSRLRHVAMVAKFLDVDKSKRHLKSGFALFQTTSILFNFI